MRVLDEEGREIELKDEDEDDYGAVDVRDEMVYQSSDDEIISEGYSIDDVPVDELGADLDYSEEFSDYDDNAEEDE